MIRLRGKYAGEHLKPIQYANNWITCESPRKLNDIVTPSQVQLEPEDFSIFDRNSTTVGSFWREWELLEDGHFRPLRPCRGKR